MTDQLKYRAKINAKGLDTTGVTEDHARRMAATLGSHHLFVVEARAATVLTDEEGNQQVALVLTQVEPVPDAQEDTVREFLRALYRQRPDQQGQAVLTGTDAGPSVSDAAGALASHIEESGGVWDGSMDGPLDPPPAPEAECPAPDCILPEDHDGDHEPEVQQPASYADEQERAQQEGPTDEHPGAHVVAFSGKGKAGRG